MRRQITLSWPDHPVMAEMVAALEPEIRFDIVGARFRQGGGISPRSSTAMQMAYCAAVLMRRSAPGAIAYQRARCALVRRAAPAAGLVHACSHLMYGPGPWLGDYENVNVLGFYSPRLLQSGLFRRHLRRVFRSEACRAIRVWSPTAKSSFDALLADEEIRAKLRVIPPAIALPAAARQPRPYRRVPRILFVGYGFWVKGGSVFLSALDRLRRHAEFRADFICDLPAECQHYRDSLAGVVDFHEPRFARNELYERFFAQADIFVMLGMADSYGLALLEASAFALPIVAMRLNSGLSDLLRMAGNGVQIEPPHQIFDCTGVHCLEPEELVARLRNGTHEDVAERVASALAQLLEDPGRRRELGERGRTAVLDGPLSVGAMRRAMADLYAECAG